ncbi:uncharacterized protein EV154DRAFT_420574, partial [Mucor mucedo]|uniref:uncharacterized protein n=1 Tax=Mucor mucedo TaxID=29922 RepID=UPI00221FF33E
YRSNQVSLEIIKALIEACHRDLNLFSKYVVKIIDMMLETKDIEIIDLACQVFVVFTNYHDGSTLGVDAELTKDYELLLQKFAGFCAYENASDETLRLQMMYIGQRALQAAVTSVALQASDFKVQLDLILSPLIITLSKSTNPANALAQSNHDVDMQQSAIGHETLNAHAVEILAAKTAALIFSKANGAGVKSSLGPIFTFMDSEEKWWPPNFAVSMMELALESLQPQYRYLLVSELLQQLESSTKSPGTHYNMEKHASLVSILDTILNANIPLVGISVLEVLNSLFTHLIKSVQDGHSFRETEPSDVSGSMEYVIQQGLVHSISGMASQTYYLNQLNDITGYIISKLRVGHHSSVDVMEGLPIVEYRKVVLQCLDRVTVSSAAAEKESRTDDTESNNENTPVYNHSVTMDAWVPALGLLLDESPETRVDFALTLVHYLEATSENEIALEHLQSLVKTSTIKNTARQRAVAAIVVEWLAMVGEFYRIDSLIQYAEDLKAERIRCNEYSPVFMVEHVGDHNTFENLEPDNTTPVDKYADRHLVVEMLSKDGPLRDEDDTEGTELDSKLLVEWGSEAYVNHDRTFRIRTSRNLSDLKAKLATPWSHTEVNRNEPGKKQTIRVENLKEALVGQPQQSDASGLQTLTNTCLAKRPNETISDMSSLLQSLSLGNDISK